MVVQEVVMDDRGESTVKDKTYICFRPGKKVRVHLIAGGPMTEETTGASQLTLCLLSGNAQTTIWKFGHKNIRLSLLTKLGVKLVLPGLSVCSCVAQNN